MRSHHHMMMYLRAGNATLPICTNSYVIWCSYIDISFYWLHLKVLWILMIQILPTLSRTQSHTLKKNQRNSKADKGKNTCNI